MGRVEAGVRPKSDASVWLRLRRTRWALLARWTPWIRWALLTLLLVDVVVAEAQLSDLVKTGGGADKVAAPPSLVAVMLVASLGAALLLRWQRVTAGALATPHWLRRLPGALRASLRTTPHALRNALPTASTFRALLERLRAAMLVATWRHWASISLAAMAMLAALIASALASGPAEVDADQWFWLAGIGLILAAACLWPTQEMSPLLRLRWRQRANANLPHTTQWRALWEVWGDWPLIMVLLGAGLALRLPGLTTMPYVVHGDEASCALEALRWLHGHVHTLLSTGWYGLPEAGYGIPALVMHFAGEGLFGLRLSSVIVGLLSLALLYLLAREFAGRRVAFVATALLTVSHLHIQFSRSGIHYIHALFAVELALWLLVRALRDRSAIAAVLAAVALSLCAQVYFSARLAFVIAPLFVIGLLLFNRRLLAGRLPTFGWLVAGLVAALGPLVAYFSANSGALNSRTNEVLILNLTAYMRGHLIDQFGTADLKTVVLRQLAAVPLLPTGVADQSTQYGPHYSLLGVGVAALVTIGFFYALLRLRQPVYLLLAIWISGTVVLGGVLTMDMPDWQRLLVMLPALCLLAALLLEDLLQRFEHGIVALAEWLPTAHLPAVRLPRLAPALAGTLLALALLGVNANWNIQRYFGDFPAQTNHDPWWTTYSDIGRYLNTLPAGTRFILFSDDSLIADYATLRFLGPGVTGERVETTSDLAQALAKSQGPTVAIVTQSQLGLMEAALTDGTVLPPGSFVPYVTANGMTTFYLFTPSGQSP